MKKTEVPKEELRFKAFSYFRLMARILFSFTLLFFASSLAFGQRIEDSEKFKKRQLHANDAVLINPSYNAQFPLVDMAKRFGFNSNVGLFIGYKFGKNWFAGLEGNYLFGSMVKENQILNNISTVDGQQITNEGHINPNKLSEEGFSIKAEAGKIFRVSKKIPESGIYLLTGFGLLQHKILITQPARLVPQLDKTYRKGYDRMSNGPVLSLATGFMFTERKKLLKFNIGCQADIAFTKNRRAWNFDEERKDNTQRYDVFVGIKVGFIIPVYTNKDNVDLY